MELPPRSRRRSMSVWHIFVFAVVVFGAALVGSALAEGSYLFGGVVLAVIAGGLPLASRMRKLRSSLTSGDKGRGGA